MQWFHGALESVTEPHYPRTGDGRHSYPLRTMLRIYLVQQWYALSDPTIEESLYAITSMRRIARQSLARGSIADETIILDFRHLLKMHSLAERILETVNSLFVHKGMMLKQGTIADATNGIRPKTEAAPASRRRIRRKSETSGTSGRKRILGSIPGRVWFMRKNVRRRN